MLSAMPLRSLFLDLNAYFASCEQQANPELRGKPVAVVPMLTDSTCCIAASYEAKKFGIKTGTRVGDAKLMCPKLILIAGHHERYIKVHHQILRAVDTVIPVHRVCSIDEMECRLVRAEQPREAAMNVARRIKRAIRDQVGECLTCSVGLAPNRVLAKIGTDMQKPDGLVCIEEHELPDRLLPLKLRDLPGVGARMERRLNIAGIGTMADLFARSEKELLKAFGSIHGAYWYRWLRGEEVVETAIRTRTIGHQHVLPPVQRNLSDARAVLVRLLHKGAARLRKKGYMAGGLHVFVRCLNDGPGGRSGGSGGSGGWGGKAGWEKCMPLGVPTDDTLTLVRMFASAWQEAERDLAASSLLMVGVTLVDLEPVYGTTLSLFAPPRPVHRLGEVMDRINTAFGKRAVYTASMHIAKESAPLRIAFSSIPDLDLPE